MMRHTAALGAVMMFFSASGCGIRVDTSGKHKVDVGVAVSVTVTADMRAGLRQQCVSEGVPAAMLDACTAAKEQELIEDLVNLIGQLPAAGSTP
jgi:CRISPR/Cas system-associated exonuclease Cas4 (RecB family)